MCKAQKMTKTALSGDSQQSSCHGVFCECPSGTQSVSRPVQAQEPCPAFPSLPQLNPARSGPRSLAQLPRGPGRVPIVQGAQGASQRSYRVQESFSVPRDVPRWSTWPRCFQPIGTVLRTKKHMVFEAQKNSKLNILFLLFDIYKEKSCFYICDTRS